MRYEQKILDMKQCDSHWYMYYVHGTNSNSQSNMPRQMTIVIYKVEKMAVSHFFLFLMIF